VPFLGRSSARKTRYEHMSSALLPNSDIARRSRHFAFVPTGDIARRWVRLLRQATEKPPLASETNGGIDVFCTRKQPSQVGSTWLINNYDRHTAFVFAGDDILSYALAVGPRLNRRVVCASSAYDCINEIHLNLIGATCSNILRTSVRWGCGYSPNTWGPAYGVRGRQLVLCKLVF
jgi:hypothetical protein